ncbi:MAG: UDP-N-acetylglucosamine 4,6-dehydratase (inverting) [Candidatus Magnetoovum sp. WYHC-5]|nr:UDP-N-acetylglucosamine 4,6-dehydratase (inverting) [Candidatus Magnetoovum sp. WYHC-5]
MFNDKAVLITGGTGTFGKKYTEYILKNFKVRKLIILSRDEFKQYEMSQVFSRQQYPIRYFLGDVRDKDRLLRAFDGVDYVIHAAALKHVPAAEYNPFEAVKTNIIGAQNIVEAAIDKGVKKVIALSTDKAVSPINLYGATKLSMEKIFVAASSYAGWKDTIFTVVRYGNVIGSRGSVVPLFLCLKKKGAKELPITDERMTRFWITIEEAVEIVHHVLEHAHGGEVFIPKLPSMKIIDLANAICEECKLKVVGIRVGEKLHESLLSMDEASTTVHVSLSGRDYFVILPDIHFESRATSKYKHNRIVPPGFTIRSDINDSWLTVQEMRDLFEKENFCV